MKTSINPFAECATHYISTGYRKCHLNAYLTYARICEDQPINKSVFFSPKPWYQLVGLETMQVLVGLCGTRTTNLYSECMWQRTPSPTVPPRAHLEVHHCPMRIEPETIYLCGINEQARGSAVREAPADACTPIQDSRFGCHTSQPSLPSLQGRRIGDRVSCEKRENDLPSGG